MKTIVLTFVAVISIPILGTADDWNDGSRKERDRYFKWQEGRLKDERKFVEKESKQAEKFWEQRRKAEDRYWRDGERLTGPPAWRYYNGAFYLDRGYYDPRPLVPPQPYSYQPAPTYERRYFDYQQDDLPP